MPQEKKLRILPFPRHYTTSNNWWNRFPTIDFDFVPSLFVKPNELNTVFKFCVAISFHFASHTCPFHSNQNFLFFNFLKLLLIGGSLHSTSINSKSDHFSLSPSDWLWIHGMTDSCLDFRMGEIKSIAALGALLKGESP